MEEDLLRRAADLAERCERTATVTSTAFLTPAAQYALTNWARPRDCPLVLHGGSGTGMDNLVRASRLGIRKLNINTELLIEAREQVRRELQEDPEIDYSVLLKHGKDAVVRRLRTYMQALHSSGKAWS